MGNHVIPAVTIPFHAHGERNISIDIVDEEEFKAGVFLDFIVRGKFDEIPSEYKLNAE
jgi:hypothetical protein